MVISKAFEQYVLCPYNKEHSAKVAIIFVSAKKIRKKSHHLDGGEYAVEGVFGAGYVEVVAL